MAALKSCLSHFKKMSFFDDIFNNVQRWMKQAGAKIRSSYVGPDLGSSSMLAVVSTVLIY